MILGSWGSLFFAVLSQPILFEIFADDLFCRNRPSARCKKTGLIRLLKGSDRFYFAVSPELKEERKGDGLVDATQDLQIDLVAPLTNKHDAEFVSFTQRFLI